MAKKYVDSIDQIIMDHVNIVDYISKYVQLKKVGRNYKGLCPFHNEKTPSFFVSEEKQLYHCFGCNAGGNVINFVQSVENLDFINAIEYIADDVRLDLSQYMNEDEQSSKEYYEKKKIMDLNREIAVFFYKNLRQNVKAQRYLKSRGINKNIIKTFGLGYSLDSWDALINKFKEKYSLEVLIKAGVISKSQRTGNYYDKFRGRVMFPIFNIQRKVIGFGGRIIEEDPQAPKYLNSPETIVFDKSRTLYGLDVAKKYLRESRYIVLVEGYMDVIMLNKYGIRNVVAVLGTSFTKSHARILKKYVDELVICFDSDAAGRKATKRAIENAKDVISKIKVISLSEGYDPDDYINEKGVEGFRQKIKDSKTRHDFYIDELSNGRDLNNEYEISEYLDQLKNVLKDIKKRAIAEMYINKIEKIINNKSQQEISKNAIIQGIFGRNYTTINENTEGYNKAKVKKKIPRQEKPVDNNLLKYEKKLLKFALHHQKNFDIIANSVDLEEFFTNNTKEIFLFLKQTYDKNLEFDFDEASNFLDVEQIKLCQSLKTPIYSDNVERDIAIYIERINIEKLNISLAETKALRKKATSAAEIDEYLRKEERLKKRIKNLNA